MAQTHPIKRVLQTPVSHLLRGYVSGPVPRATEIVASSDLPDSVKALVREVVQRSRLWRREKREVATELVAHFLDGLASGAEVQDLVRDFGDPVTAAKLIRRAKRRKRPLPWHALKWTRRSLAASVGLYVLLAVWFFLGEPRPDVDYLAQLNASMPEAPASQTAWPIYEQIQHELATDGELLRDGGRPGTPQWHATAAYLREHGTLLKTLRSAAARPVLGLPLSHAEQLPDYPYPRLLLGVPIGHVTPMRKMARLLGADLALAAAEGDGDRVVANVRALRGLAGHAAEHPILVSDLAGLSIEALTLEAVAHALDESPELFSDEQLRELAHRLATPFDLDAYHLLGERVVFADAIQHMYTPDGFLGGRLTTEGVRLMQMTASSDFVFSDDAPGAIANAAVLPAAAVAVAPADEQLRLFDELMDEAQAQLAVPPWERRFTDRTRNWSTAQKLRYFPVVAMMPTISPVIRAHAVSDTRRAVLLLALAMEAYRRDHGRWPAELSALAPPYLPAVPSDPLTGEPLHYRVTDAGPVIYSVGADRDDDGGVPPAGPKGHPNWEQVHDPDRAARWLSDDELADAPDGDWMLWPPTRETR